MKLPTEPELRSAYQGKRVLVTGHTGFKGGWLTLWLAKLGAKVTGYSLSPPTEPSLFRLAGVESACHHVLGDVRYGPELRRTILEARPSYVFHLAAQSLVRRSYEVPLETLETNVLGVANILEAIRLEGLQCAIVIVTSDKCYEDRGTIYGYRENEPMGGRDPYSMSKGAAELVVSGYRRSFFPPERLSQHGVALASARAGNVIGGGDWAADRIVPDSIRALTRGEAIMVRNPDAVRPWQHVLEPLAGYLLLGARLAGGNTDRPSEYCEAWNFGPDVESARPVGQLADALVTAWGSGRWEHSAEANPPHESRSLRLSVEKARIRLGWSPRWNFQEAVKQTVNWYQYCAKGAAASDLRAFTERQIEGYLNA
jgi:CDP-glucose 4,6-dehydratase